MTMTSDRPEFDRLVLKMWEGYNGITICNQTGDSSIVEETYRVVYKFVSAGIQRISGASLVRSEQPVDADGARCSYVLDSEVEENHAMKQQLLKMVSGMYETATDLSVCTHPDYAAVKRVAHDAFEILVTFLAAKAAELTSVGRVAAEGEVIGAPIQAGAQATQNAQPHANGQVPQNAQPWLLRPAGASTSFMIKIVELECALDQA